MFSTISSFLTYFIIVPPSPAPPPPQGTSRDLQNVFNSKPLHIQNYSFKKALQGPTGVGVWSVGLAAGMSAGCLAALLFLWTLTIMTAKLCTHEGSLGGATAPRFNYGGQEQ